MQYPKHFKLTVPEKIKLPSRRIVLVPKVTCCFKRWNGASPRNSYGHKPVLTFRRKPMFAELVILGYFRASGWDGESKGV